MLVERFRQNPLITPQAIAPSREGFEVIGTFNPGAFEFNGRVGLLVRVAERPVNREPGTVPIPVFHTAVHPPGTRLISLRRDDPKWRFTMCIVQPRGPDSALHSYLTNLSHLRFAWSEDGRVFQFDDGPAGTLWPQGECEAFGIEDPRVTQVGRLYLITYTAVSPRGICVALTTTVDFHLFAHHGFILPPENKNACFFPQKVRDEYLLLHRPSGGWCRPGIWMARSPDLIHWGGHQFVAGPRRGAWDSTRIGVGPPPVRTTEGWVVIYHGSGPRGYCVGAMLLDLEEPARVIARSEVPIMTAEADYEKNGFIGDVVFCNGLVERPDGELWLYYGGADTVTAGARCRVRDILDSLKQA